MGQFERRGRELWGRIAERNFSKGAFQILLLGSKGSGKTTLLAQLAYAGLANGDIVIWRGRSRDFWPHFPRELVKVYVHELDELHVWEIPFGTKTRKDVTNQYEITKYRDLNELLESLEPGKISVVYEPTWTHLSKELLTLANLDDGSMHPGTWAWYDIFFKLSKRVDMRWLTLIFDEIDDIVPSGVSGAQWRLIEVIQHALAEFREKYVSLYGSTHDPGHIDPRILKKFSGFCYLRGSLVPKFSQMKRKTVTMNLEQGKAIIEIIGEGYGGFRFANVPRKPVGYVIEKIWTGPEPEQPKPRKRKSLLQELTKIAKTYSPEAALEELENLRRNGEVSESYYFLIKRKLRELSLT